MTEEPRATPKACPFCGGQAVVAHPLLNVSQVRCEAGCVDLYPKDEIAIAAWNRRATPAVRDGLVERPTAEALEWQRRANLDYPPTPDTLEYRKAIQGEGEHAYTWTDKPHRLVFTLCGIIEEAAALSLRPAETRVKVKPLPWKFDKHMSMWHADTVCGRYSTWDIDGGIFMCPGDRSGAIAHGDIEEAKALCQTDFEKRIKASISEPARAEEGKEPVAWQHRIYYEDTKVWSEWRAGRHDKLLHNTWEERPLYAAPSNEAGE